MRMCRRTCLALHRRCLVHCGPNRRLSNERPHTHAVKHRTLPPSLRVVIALGHPDGDRRPPEHAPMRKRYAGPEEESTPSARPCPWLRVAQPHLDPGCWAHQRPPALGRSSCAFASHSTHASSLARARPQPAPLRRHRYQRGLAPGGPVVGEGGHDGEARALTDRAFVPRRWEPTVDVSVGHAWQSATRVQSAGVIAQVRVRRTASDCDMRHAMGTGTWRTWRAVRIAPRSRSSDRRIGRTGCGGRRQPLGAFPRRT